MTRAKRFITYLRQKPGLFHFKLYLNAYKNEQHFHDHPSFDDCMNQIAFYHDDEAHLRELERYWVDFTYCEMHPSGTIPIIKLEEFSASPQLREYKTTPSQTNDMQPQTNYDIPPHNYDDMPLYNDLPPLINIGSF